MNKCS
jgi:hypothetical protein